MSPDVLLFSSNENPLQVTRVWERYAVIRKFTFEVRVRWHSAFNSGERVRSIEAAKLVLIWNGNDPGTEWVARVCREFKRPHIFVEWGLLPQAGYFHMDPKGIVGDSSLCGSLSWVTDDDIAAYHRHRDRHLSTHGWRYRGIEDGYVLVPLQVEHDSAVYLYSPFETNEALIDAAVTRFPDRQIVATVHPRSTKAVSARRGVTIERERSTMELAQDASVVFGMNSTVLLETAMLGVPTIPTAECPLYFHTHEVERLLAACVVRQIPRSASDLDPWLSALGVSLD